MSKKLRIISKKKQPRPRADEAEFGKSPEGIRSCKRCMSVFYKKSWHHPTVFMEKFGRPAPQPGRALCPACAMITNGQYEGELVLENPPQRFLEELLSVVRAFGARAFQIDPQDRVIAIRERDRDIVVTTTENQLAAKLAKKIQTTFPPAAIRVRHAAAPSDVARVRLTFFRRETPAWKKRGAPAKSPLRRRGTFHYAVRRRK
ncbi:hypothetical protein C4552_03430 [Candidatus Parcubacteria bacterium]|nr:MAG: hypothetical protein C4552_03430 [Candidatus Parcubacteria bacterium]